MTKGWESAAYKTFRELAPALVQGEASEGYALLLAPDIAGRAAIRARPIVC